jgi:hypothetical protein
MKCTEALVICQDLAVLIYQILTDNKYIFYVFLDLIVIISPPNCCAKAGKILIKQKVVRQ